MPPELSHREKTCCTSTVSVPVSHRVVQGFDLKLVLITHLAQPVLFWLKT